MLKKCGFAAGAHQQGPDEQPPIPMRRAQVGKWTFMTMRRRDTSEGELIVTGYDCVASVGEHPGWQVDWFSAEPGTQLTVCDWDEALRLWDSQRQLGWLRGGQGAFRYLQNDDAAALFNAVHKTPDKEVDRLRCTRRS